MISIALTTTGVPTTLSCLIADKNAIKDKHNKNVLLRTFDSNNCTISDTNIHCSAYGMYANAFQNGYVEVGYSYWNCYVSEKGNSLCSFGK